ncbi:hypothetical protein LXL04_006380 [Taraxacum kok-saghyz]
MGTSISAASLMKELKSSAFRCEKEQPHFSVLSRTALKSPKNTCSPWLASIKPNNKSHKALRKVRMVPLSRQLICKGEEIGLMGEVKGESFGEEEEESSRKRHKKFTFCSKTHLDKQVTNCYFVIKRKQLDRLLPVSPGYPVIYTFNAAYMAYYVVFVDRYPK